MNNQNKLFHLIHQLIHLVTGSECTNSVLNITNENNSFSITIPGHWQTKSDEKTIDEVNKLLELRFPELHVREVRKRSIQKNRRQRI